MAKKSRMAPILMAAGWASALSLMSLVLLRTAEPGAYQYWARVGAVTVGWGIFFLCFTPLRKFRDIKVVAAKADSAVILLILVVFLLIVVGGAIDALVHKSFGAALLFGLVGIGIFNVIREMAARPAGRGKAKSR